MTCNGDGWSRPGDDNDYTRGFRCPGCRQCIGSDWDNLTMSVCDVRNPPTMSEYGREMAGVAVEAALERRASELRRASKGMDCHVPTKPVQ